LRVLLIGEAEVLSLCKMPECISAIRGAFVSLDKGVVSDPLRTRIAVSETRNILVMPSLVRDLDPQVSLKVVSIYPDIGEGKRAVNATVLLVDGSDGQVRAVMDGTSLTALRTGAVSGLSCTYLARRGSKVLGMIGAGGQSFQQVSGVVSGTGIDTVRIFSRKPEKSGELARKCETELGVQARAVEDVKECVAGCDVIVAATTSRTPVFDGSLVQEGTHVIAIGSFTPDSREVDSRLVSRSSIFVDSKEACLAEAGDLLIPIREGAIDARAIRGELSELASGTIKGRRDDSEITFFKSVGLPFEDNVTGWLIYRKALASGRGSWAEI
jgi:ornithine cyclodeaminase/alanine dehydrogenase-like protein (mu-crystallin family)